LLALLDMRFLLFDAAGGAEFIPWRLHRARYKYPRLPL
jgi:hypothetical protein